MGIIVIVPKSKEKSISNSYVNHRDIYILSNLCYMNGSGVTGSTHKMQCEHFPSLFFLVGEGQVSLTPSPRPHQTKCAHTSAKSWVHH